MRVEVLMFEGVADMDTLLPHDVFCRARLLGADVESVLVTADGATEVTGCYGTLYGGLTEWTPERADVLVVGGGWIEKDIDGPIPRHIADARRRGGDRLILAGSDSGALYLGAAGLLTGRPATTHRPGHELLAGWGAEVIDARIVDDGNIVTSSSGWLAGIDLALYLIERELDEPRLAVAIEEWIGHDRRGTVWRPPRRTP
ncbi:MAG: thiamine biosynthesis protein ThiJ, partial [Nonomuraea sp.]|nr:thiamine biosynthesis protein ThiJ [Nonomuraea sp.]